VPATTFPPASPPPALPAPPPPLPTSSSSPGPAATVPTAGTAPTATTNTSANGSRSRSDCFPGFVFAFSTSVLSPDLFSSFQTLDALPPHLVTPFNGPTPPSNLLDKIAHGVSQAKGPVDWPHSIRATRVKLIELSRATARENKAPPTDVHVPPKQPGKPFIKRPLYRQSSMDFINNAELKENTDIAWFVALFACLPSS